MSTVWKGDMERRNFLHAGSLALGALLGGAAVVAGQRWLGRKKPPERPSSRPAPAWPQGVEAQMALSLRALQQSLREGKRAGLEGLTRIRGVSSESDGDVLLLGDREPALPAVEIDDLVLALRSAYQVDEVYRQSPGCTIDPKQGASNPWQIQDAKILGMPKSAAMGARFLSADYDLKKVSVGILSLGGATDLFTMHRQAVPFCTERVTGEKASESVHRFWFCSNYPAAPRFLEDGAAVWVSGPVGVRLLTEQELLDAQARRVGGKAPDPLAQQFAESITGLLDRAEVPQYARMRGDFRTLEVGKLIRYLKVPAEVLGYLLSDHRLAAVESPSFVGGIWREDQNEVVCDHPVTEHRSENLIQLQSQANVMKLRHRVTGGVEARVEIRREDVGRSGGELAALLDRARRGRPSSAAVAWAL